ncbi:MAG: ferritin-like domain-containing protein [Pyrinomonadaceae bacterium]|nr:ferritin-like domain-containing protein [Pyrinomonadaceae bacterium]
MAIKTLNEKFHHGLGDIYDAEHLFLEAQQEMLPQAQNPQLQKLIEQHIKQTEQQIATIEQAFKALGAEPKRVKCLGANGIVTENRKTLKEVSSNPALVDLAIAGGSSKVEHYEVSCYRALVQIAEQTGQAKVAKLLQKNLAQEEQTASKVEASMPKLLQQAIKSEQGQSAPAATKAATQGSRATADAQSRTSTKSAGGAKKTFAKGAGGSQASSEASDRMIGDGDSGAEQGTNE